MKFALFALSSLSFSISISAFAHVDRKDESAQTRIVIQQQDDLKKSPTPLPIPGDIRAENITDETTVFSQISSETLNVETGEATLGQ